MNRAWRGVLHATASAYNGIPAQTALGQGGASVSQLGGPERFSNITDGTSNTLMIGELTFIDVTRRGTFFLGLLLRLIQSVVDLPGKPAA